MKFQSIFFAGITCLTFSLVTNASTVPVNDPNKVEDQVKKFLGTIPFEVAFQEGDTASFADEKWTTVKVDQDQAWVDSERKGIPTETFLFLRSTWEDQMKTNAFSWLLKNLRDTKDQTGGKNFFQLTSATEIKVTLEAGEEVEAIQVVMKAHQWVEELKQFDIATMTLTYGKDVPGYAQLVHFEINGIVIEKLKSFSRKKS